LRLFLNRIGVVPGWDEEGAVFRDSVLLLYCTVIGFVASGITASFFRLATAHPPRFALLGQGYLGTATTFAFCAVTGPAIITDIALSGGLPKKNMPAWIAGCVAVVALWSACSGIVLVQLMVAARGSI
jgi:hypothetical protein